MTTKTDFLEAIDRFLAAHKDNGWTATRLGKEALNDPSFVFNIRGTRSPSLRMVERMLKFIDAKDQELRGDAPEKRRRKERVA